MTVPRHFRRARRPLLAAALLAMLTAVACSGSSSDPATGGTSAGAGEDGGVVTGIGTIPPDVEGATAKDDSRAQPPFFPTAREPVRNIGPAVSAPAEHGPTADCVNGWSTPAPGTPDFTDPLGVIRRTVVGSEGEFVVVDMRTFDGPESPPGPASGDVPGYLKVVTRWYVKLADAADPTAFQGRFLVERRAFGRGLTAAAAFDTNGWESPDWAGFQWDSADTKARRYPGLPGKWRGIAYDFVVGGQGLTIPGLPDEVTGCLNGT